jgi:hypothetical protein
MEYVNGERIESAVRDFWLATTGYDTWWKGSNHAQRETHWNDYTRDGKTLVNTVWQDRIVSVQDGEALRRFVILGGKRRSWKKLSITHGKEANVNLSQAISARHLVVGYETVGDPTKLEKGERRVRHFCLDRAYELVPIFGTRGDDLKERLKLVEAFRKAGVLDDDYIGADPWTFELVPLTGLAPHLVNAPHAAPPGVDVPVLVPAPAPLPAPVPIEDGDDGALDEEPATYVGYAKKALPVLVAHVLAQRDGVMQRMSYMELAERIGRLTYKGVPWPRGIGGVLHIITCWIDEIQSTWNNEIPYLTSVVVGTTGDATDGLPGDGVSAKFPGYASMTRERKEAAVEVEYGRILDFGSRWKEVLRQLGIEPLEPVIKEPGTPGSGKGSSGWGGGESEAHKALKRYVAEHPELFGVAPGAKSTEEYPLHSRDVIDVFFETADEWVGIEVKSRVSDGDELDYRRGVYQAVKYRCLLEAQAKVEQPGKPISVKVYLVLERFMPETFKDLPGQLDVRVFENVVPVN